MTFYPKVQTFDGAHATHDLSAQNCAVDWDGNRLWMNDATNVSRYNIDTGAEEASVTMSSISSGLVSGLIGFAGGNIFLAGPAALNFGYITNADATSMALGTSVPLSNTVYAERGMITVGGSNSVLSSNVGNSIIGTLNVSAMANATAQLNAYGWDGDFASVLGTGGPSSNVGFLMTYSGGNNAILRCLDKLGVEVWRKTYVPADIGPGITTLTAGAIYTDEADGNPILTFVAPSSLIHLVKVSAANGNIIWNVLIDRFPEQARAQAPFSRVRSQRLGLIDTSGVGIISTLNGSIVQPFSAAGCTGLDAGVGGPQCYDDTRGCIIFLGTWDGTGPGGGGPTPLNGSTGPFTGWMALYIAEGITPPAPPVTNDDWFALMGPVRNRA